MDPLLHGHNPQEKIVALHPVGDNRMRVYFRDGNVVSWEDSEFFPFFFLSDDKLLSGFSSHYWIKELEGKNYYRFLCVFERWSDMWEAIRSLLEQYNALAATRISSFIDLPTIHLRYDPVSQYLIQSGKTHFKGMKFDDLYRMQIQIATDSKLAPSYESDARPGDPIVAVGLCDNRGWQHVIDGRKISEKELLEELVGVVKERDPDVIDGHRLYTFVLPQLLSRCEQHGVILKIGRGDSTLKLYDTMRASADGGTEAPQYEIEGRYFIDTVTLLQSYDIAKRRLERFDLKYASAFFGLETTPPQDEMMENKMHLWEREHEWVLEAVLNDAFSVRTLNNLLLPTAFRLSQIVPMSFLALTKSGSTSKIESMVIREYIRQKYSIPRPQQGNQRTGGYTALFYRGILGPVLHVDIESLYPSIMVLDAITPRSDELQIFPTLLRLLMKQRRQAKSAMKIAKTENEKTELDAFQSSLKILINSIYGYLGYMRGLFNDFEAAERVTRRGQELIKSLVGEIGQRNGKVIEVDTDGVYFVPPENIAGNTEEESFVRLLAESLPKGINLVFDGNYEKMLSFMRKNYALLENNGTLIVKGSSLISRNLEPLYRNYVHECIEHIVHEDFDGLHRIYTDTYKKLVAHKTNIHELARTETLKEPVEEYESAVAAEKRNRAASYESALAAGVQWKPGTKISYYITGTDSDVVSFRNCRTVEEWDPNFPDENVPYYLRRLDEMSKKFEEFFLPQDFRVIFSLEDLFGFSAKGVRLLTFSVREEPAVQSEDDQEADPTEFSIWLENPKG